MNPLLLIVPTPGFAEIVVILVVGLLLFGSRLPEVGRSLGKGLMELRRNMQGLRDEVYDLDRESDRRVDEEIRRRERERLAEGEPTGAAVDIEPDPLEAELERREEERRAVEPVEYGSEHEAAHPNEPEGEAARRGVPEAEIVETGPSASSIEDDAHHLHGSPRDDGLAAPERSDPQPDTEAPSGETEPRPPQP